MTAGLVLARTVLAGPQPAGETTWRHLADFHTTVVLPLLNTPDMPDAERDQLLRWASAWDGAAVLTQLAEAALDAGAMPDDHVECLLELADLIAGTDPKGDLPRPSRVDVLIGIVGGECVVLAVGEHDKSPQHSAIGETERTAAAAAVGTVLSAYQSRDPAAASWPFRPHLHWPATVALSPSGTDLPLALWLLGEIFELPAASALSVGRFDGAEFQPLPQSQLGSCVAAARTARRDLLVPVATGWQHHPADGSPHKDIRGPRTLDHVASSLWGDRWAQAKRQAHRRELELLGWHPVDWHRAPEDQPIPDLRISQVGQLERHFLDKSSPGSVAVLGGTRHSGRSAIVRQLAANLAYRRRPWLVQVICGSTRELPDRHVALAVATHAMAAVARPTDDSDRRLLIFEDLQPTGDGNASEALRFVAEQLRITVLGVVEYAANSPVDWDTDNTYVATAVVGTEARKRFVEDLAHADSTLNPGPALALLDSGESADLRTLTRKMSGDPGLASRRSVRFRELQRWERSALVFTAAVSLAAGDVAAERVDGLEDENRRLFGMDLGRTPGTVRIASVDDCLAVFELQAAENGIQAQGEPRWKTLNSAVAAQLGPELDDLLRDASPRAIELLHGVRLFHQETCQSLLRAAGHSNALKDWAATAPLLSVTRIAGLCDLMPDGVAQDVVTQMVHRACRGGVRLSASQLLALIHAYQQVEHLLTGDLIDELVVWLIDEIDAVFAAVDGRPDERFAMLLALDRLNRDDAAGLVADRSFDTLAGLTVSVEDYRLVRRVDQLYRRASRKTGYEAPYFPIDQEDPVQQLLKRKPDPDDGIGVLLEAMNLRLSLVDHDWEITFPAYETALNQAFRTATAAELALGLQGIRSPIPQFGTWLLKEWKGFPERVAELFRRSAGATDAAALLNAVARANVFTAFKILNEGASGQLARMMARRASEARDAKGIGQLLSVTRSIEDLFTEGSNTFSTDLAEAFGADRIIDLLKHDPRISVRYHVIKGVWDSQASYRSEVLDVALSVVVDAIRQGRKHWGPEIALWLVNDPEFGSIALSEIQNQVRNQQMLSGMTRATTAHARAVFHRLGRVVHPDVPALYLHQWELMPFVEGLATTSPTAALEVCAEVAHTLMDADISDAGRQIAGATGGASRWTPRLRTVRNEESFVQAVRHLTALDPATAGETLDGLRKATSHVTINGRPADALLARLRRALLGEPTRAPAMLRAIHNVRPQLAKDLLDDVSADRHANFVFRGEIQQIQNPVAQSTAARDLVKVGVTRESGRAWIEPVYKARIQGLHRFSNPRAVTALLRMMSAWDSGWGSAAAQGVNITRIKNRLAFAAIDDVADAIELVRTMAALENTAGAQQLLEVLLDLDITRLGNRLQVTSLCSLVDVLSEILPEAVPRISRTLATALQALVNHMIVSDERAHWLQVGRASRILNQVGAPPSFVGEPPTAPNMAYAAVVAWAATGLGQLGWRADALGRAASRLTSLHSVPNVTDRACLLSATGKGWASKLRSDQTGWNVGRAPFWLLRALYAEEATDPYVAQVLSTCESTIRERINEDISRSDWDASRLQLILNTRSFLHSQPIDETMHPPLSET
ncbi:hypothetical protein ABZ883_02400 [Streptomyces sp. NPDC046977]|uniref:hypothetical protein n=1 Tax=Streptomyces sp. NPDC046977 TaxID=3154703 RepID=UPI0033FA1CE1